ncbi:DegT/DnrJ/EryC1/StrS family aminotransferase [Devosia nitrariae]|uniref:Aminotransferase DegT n=1 Tax=Devosia nitrariae TaxID=2071872 RepID=A0ABQ5WEM8_9HYPH|nr:DegT/DnrJ/EryC1/StrS family aminotransferase [Devosia nitrariae]GLQ57955.1 aminotransferase DegT [Devosia nitrariae]
MTDTHKLALNGGIPVFAGPLPTGSRFGAEELAELKEALDQNTLFYFYGQKVKTFARQFAEMHGAPAAVATSSGTAALHVAVGCLDLTPGDEVITSPVTDFGTVIGLLYQGLVPVFADLDPSNGLMTPQTVEAVVTDRTRAVLAVHLAGNPCDLTGLKALCERHGLALIEDCAQAFLARHGNSLVGTIGRFGCFSTNDYKHISTGDGGLLLVADETDAAKAAAFADKNYRRDLGSAMRRIDLLAPNLRMTELQGAVGIAQLKRLPSIVERRQAFGDGLRAALERIPGLTPMAVRPQDTCVYWFFTLTVDAGAFRGGRDALVEALKAEGLPACPGYLEEPLYKVPMLRNRTAFPGTNYPFDLAPLREPVFPGAEAYLADTIVLPVSEFYGADTLAGFIEALEKCTSALAG